MRGQNREQTSMLVMGSLQDRIPADHPIRRIKLLADEALSRLHPTFEGMYSQAGRPSIPPERLLKAQILMALFTVRSDRMFCEQLEYNLLFRWFLDMEMDEAAFDASTFSKNRKRLIDNEIGQSFLAAVVESASLRRMVSSDHFSVDGTLIEAWASMKSFKRKDDDTPSDSNGWNDFRGEKRSNETHESKTDPESRLARKGDGREAKLCFNASGLMENRNGLILKMEAGTANGTAERDVAIDQIQDLKPGSTVAADRAYDTKAFIALSRDAGITPHVAQIQYRRSAVDGRTTRHAGYEISLIRRRMIEGCFGWMKTIGNCRRTRFRGVPKTNLLANITAAAYNLVRIARLMPEMRFA
jgi:transposase